MDDGVDKPSPQCLLERKNDTNYRYCQLHPFLQKLSIAVRRGRLVRVASRVRAKKFFESMTTPATATYTYIKYI